MNMYLLLGCLSDARSVLSHESVFIILIFTYGASDGGIVSADRVHHSLWLCCCVDRLPKTDKSSDITKSAVYKMIHGIDQPRPRPRAPLAEG